MGLHLYIIATALVVFALFWGRSRGGNSLHSRNISNANVHVGDVIGDSSNTPRDKVAWAIGISGVAVACLQLGYDIYEKSK